MSTYKAPYSARPSSALELSVPSTQTGLMQLLQLLVGRERHRHWCGGRLPAHKLEAFVEKMASRYPAITRNARQRAYDRKRGHAVMHLVVYPVEGDVFWWLLSDGGIGGLTDAAMPDAHVSRDAHLAQHHIEFNGYVLLYATKPVPARAGAKASSTSTWTWKMTGQVLTEVQASIEEACRELAYGAEGTNGWGLRRILELQRRRPLFSGVRNQVIELHRFTRSQWDRRRPQWCHRHPELTARYGNAAGALLSVQEIMRKHLPTMPRLKVYGAERQRIKDLCTIRHCHAS